MGNKINLGSGTDVRGDWINIDLSENADMKWDLSLGLPPNLSDIDYVYSSHFLEHLPDDQVLSLLRECKKKMNPGAVIRLCLPDFRKQAENYLSGNRDFFAPLQAIYGQGMNPETSTLIDFVSYCAYQFGEHKGLWDVPKALKYLEIAEFVGATESSFSPEIDFNNGLRIKYSFYVTAGV